MRKGAITELTLNALQLASCMSHQEEDENELDADSVVESNSSDDDSDSSDDLDKEEENEDTLRRERDGAKNLWKRFNNNKNSNHHHDGTLLLLHKEPLKDALFGEGDDESMEDCCSNDNVFQQICNLRKSLYSTPRCIAFLSGKHERLRGGSLLLLSMVHTLSDDVCALILKFALEMN